MKCAIAQVGKLLHGIGIRIKSADNRKRRSVIVYSAQKGKCKINADCKAKYHGQYAHQQFFAPSFSSDKKNNGQHSSDCRTDYHKIQQYLAYRKGQ